MHAPVVPHELAGCWVQLTAQHMPESQLPLEQLFAPLQVAPFGVLGWHVPPLQKSPEAQLASLVQELAHVVPLHANPPGHWAVLAVHTCATLHV
jgi:hypothetical protein